MGRINHSSPCKTIGEVMRGDTTVKLAHPFTEIGGCRRQAGVWAQHRCGLYQPSPEQNRTCYRCDHGKSALEPVLRISPAPMLCPRRARGMPCFLPSNDPRKKVSSAEAFAGQAPGLLLIGQRKKTMTPAKRDLRCTSQAFALLRALCPSAICCAHTAICPGAAAWPTAFRVCIERGPARGAGRAANPVRNPSAQCDRGRPWGTTVCSARNFQPVYRQPECVQSRAGGLPKYFCRFGANLSGSAVKT